MGMGLKGFLDTDCIENIMGKGEISHFEQFHLFPHVFQKLFSSVCKMSIYGGKV